MSSDIFDPTRLVDAVQASSSAADHPLPFASSILKTVYLCGLYKEEGHDVRCRLLVVHSFGAGEDFDTLRFVDPIPLSVPALRRLSLATSDPHAVFVVDCSGSEPVIVGFGRRTAASAYLSAMGFSRHPHYEVACTASGIVDLSVGETAARFARDRYIKPDLWRAVSAAVHDQSARTLVNRVAFPGIEGWIGYSMGHGAGITEPTLFGLHKETLIAEARQVARPLLTEYLDDLVREIRNTGRGGALLVLTEIASAGNRQLMTGTHVARPHKRYRDELWNAGVLNAFDWMVHLRMADLGKMVLINEEAMPPKAWIRKIGLDGFGKAIDTQTNDAKRVAQLTAIDGAVVVNGFLSPLMFGAKFATVDIRQLPEVVARKVSERGMRHRSMAATVSVIPESAGIVVSQDGDATVFVNRGGVMCCHQEAEESSSEPNPCCHNASTARIQRLHELMLEIMKRLEHEDDASS